MNEAEIAILQAMVEYYRNKCNKLEYDFVLYQAQSKKIIGELTTRLDELSKNKESGNDSRKKNDPA